MLTIASQSVLFVVLFYVTVFMPFTVALLLIVAFPNDF